MVVPPKAAVSLQAVQLPSAVPPGDENERGGRQGARWRYCQPWEHAVGRKADGGTTQSVGTAVGGTSDMSFWFSGVHAENQKTSMRGGTAVWWRYRHVVAVPPPCALPLASLVGSIAALRPTECSLRSRRFALPLSWRYRRCQYSRLCWYCRWRYPQFAVYRLLPWLAVPPPCALPLVSNAFVVRQYRQRWSWWSERTTER